MGDDLSVPGLAGAVLTGGASRRMGRDKALLPVDGVPLAVRVARVLAEAGADPVLAVGGDLDGLRAAGLTAVPDPRQGAGPLAGIAAALRALDADIVVVLACDLPAASALAVRAVVDALAADPDAHVAVPVVDGLPQPLHAAWRRSALPVVEAALDAGQGAVRHVLDALSARPVAGLDPAWFANANHPGDLAADSGA
ncbi:MAG: putative molybdenum cofactor biosynthesis protein [Actinomycetia bacterium]|nr:putative molybdenum cofactor biosynthesis protein [Actinomycetes bacterium]